MVIYAYARVSAHDQNLARQLDAFSAFGVENQNIYSDKKSGKDFERSEYKKLVKKIKKDDLLVIKSIDRLGRNYDQIIQEWEHITRTIGADILVLDMPLLDTRTKADTLVGKFISDVVLQVLSFVAENERANIKVRQKEGIASAKARGVSFGRPKREYDGEFMCVVDGYLKKKIPLQTALRKLHMKEENFYYHIRKIKQGRI